MGNYDPTRRVAMRWQSTLGAMKEAAARVRLLGCGCGFYGDADLDHFIRLLGGPEMTLWDCRPPCPLCGDLMHFMASAGPGTPFRPLISHPGDSDASPLPPDAWMPGWTGRQWW